MILNQACTPKLKQLKSENESFKTTIKMLTILSKKLKEENEKLNWQLDEANFIARMYREGKEELKLELKKIESAFDTLYKKYWELTMDTNSTSCSIIYMETLPGRIRRNNFYPQVRARKTELMQINFTLSRYLKDSEKIYFKAVHDSLNTEIPLRNDYSLKLKQQFNLAKKSLLLEPQNYIFTRGTYSVYIYIEGKKKDVKKLGMAKFMLK